MRILIVDDDPLHARATQAALAPLRADIETDSVRALARLTSTAYDVAIVDVGMPGMSGDTLVWTLRAFHGARTRVVLVSGRSEDELAEIAARCGANATLMKPFSAEALAVIVRAWG